MDAEERRVWLAERKMGSSDAAPACGMRTFGRGPFELYLEKRGLMPASTMTIEQEVGLLLEPLIARLYQQETGLEVTLPVYPEGRHVLTHPEHHWMTATPDRFAEGRIVELKTAGDRTGWGLPGTDEVASSYLLQVQHQLAVAGLERADVAVLFGRSDFRIYTVRRHEPIVALLIEREGELWQRIERQDPPEPDWRADGLPALLDLLYKPKPGVEMCMEDTESLDNLAVYAGSGPLIKGLEKEKEVAKARLIARMGEAEIAHLPDGRTIRRQKVEECDIAYTRKAYHAFHILKAKGKQHGDYTSGDED